MSPVVGATSSAAPPVVAVMVVHEPGEWFADSLRSLGAQDYPSLQILILVSGNPADPGARATLDAVETNLPSAVARFTGGNVGFAASCNAVLNLVQGDSGFFCFLHDDVALAPDAITQLVEELYRSNAGMVAPKLVHWDDPRMIESVGVAVDRFGVALPVADDGEIDQEQHDAVQDVFAVSSACMLVRADLFRSIGGFNPRLSVTGADLDLSWRCHIAAARVVVVPGSVARHRRSMSRRFADGDDPLEGERESVRVATVASLSAPRQLPLVLAQLTVLTLLRVVTLVLTGRLKQAGAELRGVLSLPVAWGDVRKRRADVARYRAVDDVEIRALQLRGTAHLTAFLRRRARRAGLSQSSIAESEREAAPRSSIVLWVTLAALLLVGSRLLITGGVSSVGQFVPAGAGPRALLASYASGWWGAAFGQVSAVPTGVALTAAAGVATLGHMELVRTLSVVLLPLAGWIGMWRFASVFGSRASRIAGTLAYAAVPLPYAAMASGRWGALLLYACVPWLVHHMRVLVGHTAVVEGQPRPVVEDRGRPDADVFVDVAPPEWRRAFASAVLVAAVALAFEPAVLVVMAVITVVCAVVTLVQSGAGVRALQWCGAGAGVFLCAVGLNLPWVASYVRRGWWEALVGAPVEHGRGWGLAKVASFGVGNFTLAVACIALYAAVVGAVVLVHGPKTPWALRGASLTVVGLLLVVLDDRALVPAHLPEPAVMLVPVAFGIAVSAATMGGMLVADLRRGRFGWRQPLGALLALVFLVGLAPVPINALNGAWSQPSYSLPRLLAQLPTNGTIGQYRTMFLGDARVLPGAPLNLGWGVSYSVVNGPSPELVEMWEIPPNRLRDEAVTALYGIVRGRTSRAGRLLAPLSVRYIVVPIIDGAASTRDDPIPTPRGLVDVLSRQLDLRRQYSSPDLVIFENSTWVPVRSQLTPEGAAASARAGAESMISGDISGAAPVSGATRPDADVTFEGTVGTFHLSVPFTSRWRASAPAGPIAARPAFGLTNGYDITAAGPVTVSFDVSPIQTSLVLAQLVAWCLFAFIVLDRRRDRSNLPRSNGNAVAHSQDGAVFTIGEGAPR